VLKAFDSDSGKLFGVVHGEGRASVLALHGWRRTSADFDRVLAGLGAGGPAAVALDLPGFGASPEPPEAWGAADYAKAVAAAVAGPEFAPPLVVLGHSFGGRVALCLAADRPDLVRALVLTGVPLIRRAGGGAKPALSYRLVRWLHRRGLVGDERMEALRRTHGSADYRAATGVMRDVFVRVVNESYEEQLGRVRCPVELVWADDDAEARIDQAESALGLLGERGSLTRLPAGTGHLTPLTAPDALRAALERAL
jgi:pimeloyl-ACP methyl ester carboxylesterase